MVYNFFLDIRITTRMMKFSIFSGLPTLGGMFITFYVGTKVTL